MPLLCQGRWGWNPIIRLYILPCDTQALIQVIMQCNVWSLQHLSNNDMKIYVCACMHGLGACAMVMVHWMLQRKRALLLLSFHLPQNNYNHCPDSTWVERIEYATYMTMTQTILSSTESSCLAICSPRTLHVNIHCCLFLCSLSKKLEFVPVASAMSAVHGDHLILASYMLHSQRYSLHGVSCRWNSFRWSSVTDRHHTAMYWSDIDHDIIYAVHSLHQT